MSAPTSNIQGTFRDSKGNPRAGAKITLQPLDTPFASGGDIVVSGLHVITLDSFGKFGFTPLYAAVRGTYRVVVSDLDAFVISVPDDGGTYDIHEIAVDVGTGEVLKTVVSAGDLARLLKDTYTIKKSLKTDPHAERFRICVLGEGTILPLDRLFTLFKSLNPSQILSLGNANPSGSALDIDYNIGQSFHEYIEGYSGSYGTGALASNGFFYALGNADWIPGNVTAVTNFLTLPGNERYYKQPIHGGVIDLFIVSSQGAEPDGTSANSLQANWLKTGLAASTARFKIVAFRDTYISSKSGYSNPIMLWPFAAWGAHLIIAAGAKNYERIVDATGLPVIVCGTTTNDPATLEDFGPPVSGSQVRAKVPGILALDYNAYSLNCTFLDWNGTVADQFEIFGPDTTNLYLYHQIARHGGLMQSPEGTKPDFGSAGNQIMEGGPENFISLQTGRTIRRNIPPSPADMSAWPYYRDCLLLLGDDPASLYYWNDANSTWDPLIINTRPPYQAGKAQLPAPILYPNTSEETTFCEITHNDSTVEIWYSVNGAPFQQMVTFPSPNQVLYNAPGNWWIASYARKTGFSDSGITTASYHTPFKQFSN